MKCSDPAPGREGRRTGAVGRGGDRRTPSEQKIMPAKSGLGGGGAGALSSGSGPARLKRRVLGADGGRGACTRYAPARLKGGFRADSGFDACHPALRPGPGIVFGVGTKRAVCVRVTAGPFERSGFQRAALSHLALSVRCARTVVDLCRSGACPSRSSPGRACRPACRPNGSCISWRRRLPSCPASLASVEILAALESTENDFRGRSRGSRPFLNRSGVRGRRCP